MSLLRSCPSMQRRNGGDSRPVSPEARFHGLVSLLLVAAVVFIYWPLQDADFISFDDAAYVYRNPDIQKPLDGERILWSFKAMTQSNWHPLTWLSLSLDYRLFGLNASGYHWNNVLLHAANSLLLFFVLSLMTSAPWRSAFVSLLFAIHPIHVESVAWISERKDVLSTLFWMLAMGAYVFYVRKRTFPRYGTVLIFFVLGLLSKPMVVTFPVVLLLLDFWPLRRFRGRAGTASPRDLKAGPSNYFIILEKVPFLLLSLASSVLTLQAQQAGHAVATLESLSFPLRMENAVVAYGTYLFKTFWPFHLSVFYPHPKIWPWQIVLLSGAVLAAMTALSAGTWKKTPFLTVGWFWFLGTLVPVIGIVQVGSQALADRYGYIPLIGVFIILAWAVPDTWKKRRGLFFGTAVAAVLWISMLLVLARIQAGYWVDTKTLFSHAIAVTANNFLAHNHMGAALEEEGRLDEAAVHYREALRIKPDYEAAYINLGNVQFRRENYQDAENLYRTSLKYKPDNFEPYYNLAVMYLKLGRLGEAGDSIEKSIALEQGKSVLHNVHGLVLNRMGRKERAVRAFEKALLLDPDHAGAHNNLAMILASAGRENEAADHFRTALKIEPRFANAHFQLGIILQGRKEFPEARHHFREALRINPAYGNEIEKLDISPETKEDLLSGLFPENGGRKEGKDRPEEKGTGHVRE